MVPIQQTFCGIAALMDTTTADSLNVFTMVKMSAGPALYYRAFTTRLYITAVCTLMM